MTDIEEAFALAASRFDSILIDNRLFFDCACGECARAKGGVSWAAWRRERLTETLERRALAAARAANPRARLILKFPSWHESIATRGYDPRLHSTLFPQTCAGAETRDPQAIERWGGRQPYGGYFTAAYLRAAAPERCPGAWIDTLACDEVIFCAQAWGAALAGASEIVLYSYDAFAGERLGKDAAYPPAGEALDQLLATRSELDSIAETVRETPARGIACYRPPFGDPRGEPYAFDYLGMLGLPAAPALDFPSDAPAAAFAQCSNDGPDFAARFVNYVESGRPALATSRLLDDLGLALGERPNLVVWDTRGLRFTDRIKRLPDEKAYDNPALPRADIWFDRPAGELAALRGPFYQGLGIANLGLEELPARIGVFPLGERRLALFNYNTGIVRLGSLPGRRLWAAPLAEGAPGDPALLAGGAAALFEF